MPVRPSHLPIRQWFQCDDEGLVPWPGLCHAGGLVAAMNFTGEAELTWSGGTTRKFRSNTLAWLRTDGAAALLRARRLPGRRHECLVIFFPDSWMQRLLAGVETSLLPEVRPLVTGPAPSPPWATAPLQPDDRAWARGFVAPHLCEAARKLLDEARLTEFFLRNALGVREPAEPQVNRTQRLARERIERVKSSLLARLDEPPTLEELARAAGCHAHSLSRTFTQVEGLSLTLWLRRMRIDRAAELIATGRCNVSEAALEVGYHSLSHFSRAFLEEKGVNPSKWTGHNP